MKQEPVYAFYGSLRKGMENHEPFQNHLEYLFSARLKGFKLYSRGQYPFAVRSSDSDSIVVEVFKINNVQTEQGIHQLELDEGYYLDHVDINGQRTGIYLFESSENYPLVQSGDWVTFYRERNK